MYVIEDFERLISRFEQLALVEVVHQLITVLRRRYRLQLILQAILDSLIEYMRGRDSWGLVSQHLRLARQAMLEVSSSPQSEDDNQIG